MFFFSENLYQQILMDPIKKGATGLHIVSGFATPTMATKHMIDISNALKQKEDAFKIDLLLGMVPRCKMGVNSHENFKTLMQNEYKIPFSCKYVYNIPPVHSKLYIFSKDNTPVKAFIGSANYTQTGFGSKQLEVVNTCNPSDAMSYFSKIESKSILCDHADVEEYVDIINEKTYRNSFAGVDMTTSNKVQKKLISNSERITVSLLTRQGETGHHSGLNWGQRETRNPNQAYIGLTSAVYKTDFFPPRGSVFTILTDDNKSIICVRAQDNGKAIHSTSNNALLGEYFRNRLGLANGQYVKRTDLEKYGRTNVTFTKIDDETYCMDFSIG